MISEQEAIQRAIHAVRPAPQPQPGRVFHPVLDLFFPMFLESYKLADSPEDAIEDAQLGFRALGFEWLGGLNCRPFERE